MSRPWNKLGALLAFFSAMLIGVLAAFSFQDVYRSASAPDMMCDLIAKNFAGKIIAGRDCKELILKIGVSSYLQDRHSTYLTPADYQILKEETNGRFGGVGLYLMAYDKKVVVAESLRGTPAEESGAFIAGDIVVGVNGENVKGKTMAEIVSKIRGEEGTTVTIRVRRGQEFQKPVILGRRAIDSDSVEAAIIGNDIGYINLSKFTDKTYLEFLDVVGQMYSDNYLGCFSPKLIVDVRDNPGGLLGVVEKVGLLFANNDNDRDVVITFKNRSGVPKHFDVHKLMGRKNSPFASPRGILHNAKVVVLVNHGSASAAEILSALLRDWLQAPLVGEKTFGKGSVQTIFDLPDGGALKLTTAEYFVGNGKIKVDGVGLTPDYFVANHHSPNPLKNQRSLNNIDQDEQLKVALRVIKAM